LDNRERAGSSICRIGVSRLNSRNIAEMPPEEALHQKAPSKGSGRGRASNQNTFTGRKRG